MLAAEATPGPLLLMANIDPQYPGMVGMLAGGGGLDQIGRTHSRAWGDIADPDTRERVLVAVRAAAAVQRLRGQTFGRIGGRPMGMYTAVANTDQWMRTFGVDVEEIDQWEIVRRSEHVEQSRVTRGPGVAGAARGQGALRRRPAHPGAAGTPDPLLPRDA